MPLKHLYIFNIWDFTADKAADGSLPQNKDNREVWHYLLCKANKRTFKYVLKGGTRQPIKYLKIYYSTNMLSIIQIHKNCDKTGIKTIIDFIKVNVVKSIKYHRFGNGYKNLNKSLLLEIFCRLIAYNNLLFNLCRSPAFQIFLKIINLKANNLLHQSLSTIAIELEEDLAKKKPIIKQILHQAISKIHLIIDNWILPNLLNLYGVIIQFVDAKYSLQHLTIHLKKIPRSYNGENIANII